MANPEPKLPPPDSPPQDPYPSPPTPIPPMPDPDEPGPDVIGPPLEPLPQAGRSIARPKCMIRKISSGEYRLYSRKKDAKTGRRKNLGTFKTQKAAKAHERAVQYFKHAG